MLKSIDDEIAAKRKELANLEARKAKIEEMKPLYHLAETIHAARCPHSHEDRCTWYYSSWEKIDTVREQYLKRAAAIQAVEPNLEHAMRVIQAFLMEV